MATYHSRTISLCVLKPSDDVPCNMYESLDLSMSAITPLPTSTIKKTGRHQHPPPPGRQGSSETASYRPSTKPQECFQYISLDLLFYVRRPRRIFSSSFYFFVCLPTSFTSQRKYRRPVYVADSFTTGNSTSDPSTHKR